MSFIINPNSFSWVKKKQCKIAEALMDLILPNTDNMIFNTSCMHFIPLVFDISFCVSGLAHLHMPLRPPLVTIQELPITLYKLVRRRFGERNENSREENNILSMCAFAVFSILIIFTCNYRERGHLRYFKFSTVASYEGGGPRGCFNTCSHVNLKATLYCP